MFKMLKKSGQLKLVFTQMNVHMEAWRCQMGIGELGRDQDTVCLMVLGWIYGRKLGEPLCGCMPMGSVWLNA